LFIGVVAALTLKTGWDAWRSWQQLSAL